MRRRQYAEVFRLTSACVTDSDLTADERAIFRQLTRVMSADDHHPDALSCRLKLSLICMDSPMKCPWDVGQELRTYALKFPYVSAVCRLTAEEEHILLGVAQPMALWPFADCLQRTEWSNRHAYVQALIMGQSVANASVPPRPKFEREWDTVLDKTSVDPSVLAMVANKFTNTSYTRPDECKGAAAALRVHMWMDSGFKLGGGSDNLGFLFAYELMTGTLQIKILNEDSTYGLANVIM
jgi:hypothetical protein